MIGLNGIARLLYALTTTYMYTICCPQCNTIHYIYISQNYLHHHIRTHRKLVVILLIVDAQAQCRYV